MVHDQHLLMMTATGKLLVRGSGTWNNAPVATGPGPARVLMWDASPTGSLPPP